MVRIVNSQDNTVTIFLPPEPKWKLVVAAVDLLRSIESTILQRDFTFAEARRLHYSMPLPSRLIRKKTNTFRQGS